MITKGSGVLPAEVVSTPRDDVPDGTPASLVVDPQGNLQTDLGAEVVSSGRVRVMLGETAWSTQSFQGQSFRTGNGW